MKNIKYLKTYGLFSDFNKGTMTKKILPMNRIKYFNNFILKYTHES